MKKGYKRLLVFEIVIFVFLLLNSFINNYLNNYSIILFLGIILLIFKKIFGFEKDRHRYIKDIIIETIIFLVSFFLLYYILGIVIGFVRIRNYYNFNGLINYIFPTILLVILKEYLRYVIVCKSEDNILLRITTVILFILFDVILIMSYKNFSSNYSMFLFIAITLMPSISYNTVMCYLTLKCGYKPIMLYSLIINLYLYLIPIIPNPTEYIYSVIYFILPIVYFYRIYMFYEKDKDRDVTRRENKRNYLPLTISFIVVSFLVYLTSGYFKYWAVAIASGSMTPNINKGDVVVIEKIDNKFGTLKEGEVIAFKSKNVIVVHRLINVVKNNNKYYFYTKGDANNDPDNFVIEESMVVGRVNIKVPYIGYPTVWLNQL